MDQGTKPTPAPAATGQTIDDLLADQQAGYDKARALFGLPPIPLNYTGPLRRKNRDRDAIAARLRASRDGVEL